MPGKPQHAKKKHIHQSKKSRAMQRFGIPVQPPAAMETAATPANAAAPVVPKKPVAAAKAITAQHQYVVTELRRIGILAGIIVAILIIASIIIP